MAMITRKATILGKKVTLEFNVPDNQAMNEYMAERLKMETDDALFKFRANMFDAWCASVDGGLTKADVFNAHKSAIMYQIFEAIDVEKN